jgi:hypothetical protein
MRGVLSENKSLMRVAKHRADTPTNGNYVCALDGHLQRLEAVRGRARDGNSKPYRGRGDITNKVIKGKLLLAQCAWRRVHRLQELK